MNHFSFQTRIAFFLCMLLLQTINAQSLEAEEKDFELIQQVFGKEVVILKKARGKSKLNHPFQKTLMLPF